MDCCDLDLKLYAPESCVVYSFVYEIGAAFAVSDAPRIGTDVERLSWNKYRSSFGSITIW